MALPRNRGDGVSGSAISPSDVRAGVARELRALAEDGREGPDALRDAVEITRAKIRNSEALAERQANGAACHVCDEPLDDSAPVVAVLSGKPRGPLFLHAGCHDAYRTRRDGLGRPDHDGGRVRCRTARRSSMTLDSVAALISGWKRGGYPDRHRDA